MTLLQLDQVVFGYAGEPLLQGVSLAVDHRARLGIVGPNGSGKSTLLKLLAGELTPDRGRLIARRALRTGYLPQNPKNIYTGTVREAALAALRPLTEIKHRLRELEALLGADPALHEEYALLRERLESAGGDHFEINAEALLTKIGFGGADLFRPVESLSGGETSRLTLCCTLLESPELLLLDEPTNHLDLNAQAELEAFAGRFPGAIVAASHDRSYLENCCTRIIELQRGGIQAYPGPYHRYRELREERFARDLKAFQRQQEEIARTEDFIRRNLAGQKTKQAQARRKQLAKLDRLEKPPGEDRRGPLFDFGKSGEIERANNEVAGLRGVAKSFSGRVLFREVNLTLYRGQRAGLIGPNGSGKTTLINILRGVWPPDAGAAFLGNRIRLGLFEQDVNWLNPRASILDELYEAAKARRDYLRVLQYGDDPAGLRAMPEIKEEELRKYAGRFLFSGDDVFRAIGSFSGGEQNRIRLMGLLLRPFNFLIMDEPTNHLDLPAREALEDALSDYPGTLLMVSHDRYFLDAVCERLWVVENETVQEFPGNYEDYLRARGGLQEIAPLETAAGPEKERRKEAHALRRQTQRERERLLRRRDEAEREVTRLERLLEKLRGELAAGPPGDWQRAAALTAQQQETEVRLEEALAQWASLDAEVERTAETHAE